MPTHALCIHLYLTEEGEGWYLFLLLVRVCVSLTSYSGFYFQGPWLFSSRLDLQNKMWRRKQWVPGSPPSNLCKSSSLPDSTWEAQGHTLSYSAQDFPTQAVPRLWNYQEVGGTAVPQASLQVLPLLSIFEPSVVWKFAQSLSLVLD